MGQYALHKDIEPKYLDCCLRVDTSNHYCGNRSSCHALEEMFCATRKHCPFYASRNEYYVRRFDGFVCKKERMNDYEKMYI